MSFHSSEFDPVLVHEHGRPRFRPATVSRTAQLEAAVGGEVCHEAPAVLLEEHS